MPDDTKKTIHLVLTAETVAMLDDYAEEDRRDPCDKTDRSRTMRAMIRAEALRRNADRSGVKRAYGARETTPKRARKGARS